MTPEMENEALRGIDHTLRAAHDLSIAADFPTLPAPLQPDDDQQSELMKAARAFDPAEQQHYLHANLGKLNADQQRAYEEVIAATALQLGR